LKGKSETEIIRAWRAISISFILNGIAIGSFVSRIPDFKRILHVSNSAFGFSLFFVSLGVMSALRPAGKFCAKYGSASITLISGFGIALSLLPFGQVSEYPLFCVTLFFYGFLNASQDIAMNTHAVALESLSGKRMMVTFHGMWSVGAIIGGGLSALFINFHTPFHDQYLFISFLIICLVLYTRKGFLPDFIDQSKNLKEDRSKTPKIIFALGCLGLCASLGEGASADWGGLLAKETFGASSFYATLPYIFFMGGMILGRLSGDKLAEIFGIRHILTFSGALFGSALLIGLIIGSLIAEIFAWLFVGLGVAAVIPIIVSTTGSMVLREYKDVTSPSEAVATVTAINYSGFFFGPPLMGFLADQLTLRWAMLLPALLGFALMAGARLIIKN
jgi:MFS family permease